MSRDTTTLAVVPCPSGARSSGGELWLGYHTRGNLCFTVETYVNGVRAPLRGVKVTGELRRGSSVLFSDSATIDTGNDGTYRASFDVSVASLTGISDGDILEAVVTASYGNVSATGRATVLVANKPDLRIVATIREVGGQPREISGQVQVMPGTYVLGVKYVKLSSTQKPFDGRVVFTCSRSGSTVFQKVVNVSQPLDNTGYIEATVDIPASLSGSTLDCEHLVDLGVSDGFGHTVTVRKSVRYQMIVESVSIKISITGVTVS